MNLRQALKGKLTKKELGSLRTAFDVVGSIAVIEIPKELVKKERVIAQTLLALYNNLKTVAKKADIHKGKFRTQKLKILAGDKTKETIYKENGVRLKLNIEKLYFSPRLSTERKRVMQQVKKGESILVMFSGAGVYPLVLAKNSKAKIVYGIELNPIAHKYGLENVKLNRLEEKIRLIQGDVRKVMPKLIKKFDRVLMPLPKGAIDFLDLAINAVKKGGIVHFYDFEHETEFELGKEKIRKACKKSRKKCRILRLVRCGQHAPRIYRVCIDFKLI